MAAGHAAIVGAYKFSMTDALDQCNAQDAKAMRGRIAPPKALRAKFT
jgi:hypothetical protein